LTISSSPALDPSLGPDAPLPDLGYRYAFQASEPEAVVKCVHDHGFAIVKNLISETVRAQMQAAVERRSDPEGKMPRGESKTDMRILEHSPAMLTLFDNPEYMALTHALLGGRRDLTVRRAASILRKPEAWGMAWHSDWDFAAAAGLTGTFEIEGDPLREDDVSLWFYLTGCYPRHGGIAIIPDSHVKGWQPAPGYKLNALGKSFERVESNTEERYKGFDLPGMMPVIAGGRDAILFHIKTYHGVFANREEWHRISCSGFGFRVGRHALNVPWPLPEDAKRLKAELRANLQPYFEHYPSFFAPNERPGAKPAAPKPMM
jgi:ectoine hydroxylase-related dioxygenase (phytanoyl-CoA dioxygenase family)